MKKVLFFLLIFILFSCKEDNDEIIVAQVNDAKLTLQQLKGNYSELEWQNLSKLEKEKQINYWIQLTVLAQAADKEGLSQNQKIKNKIEFSKLKIKGNALISKTFNEIEISDDELLEFYNIHKNDYKTTEKQLKIQQIYSDSENKIDAVRKKILNGLQFKQAAIEFSEDKFASIGGYAGFKSENDLGKDVWDRLNKLKRYVFIKVEMDEGFYLIRHYRSQEVETFKRFLEVKEDIRQRVIENKKKEIFDNLIKDLRQKSEIKISNL